MAMTADPELERHLHTWIGFTRFIKWAVAVLVVVLIVLGLSLTPL
ncbi:MAG: hypothetical protein ACREE4_15460 [Stellaceae bacterium]